MTTNETTSAAPPSPTFDQWQQTRRELPAVLAGIFVIANIVALFVVFGSDRYFAENVMGQILNAASRTNGLLVMAVIDLVVIGAALMIRR